MNVGCTYSGPAAAVLHPVGGRVGPPAVVVHVHEPAEAAGVPLGGAARGEAALRHPGRRRLRA